MNNGDLSKIKGLLRFVMKNKLSDFYRAKYGREKFSPLAEVRAIDDIRKIPLLAKKELSEAGSEKILFVEEEKISHIAATTGTTGRPLLTFRSKPDKPNDQKIIKNVDFGRIMFLINPLRACRIYSSNARSKYGLLAGDIHNLPTSCRLAAQLKIKTVFTTPSLAIILSDYLKRYPALAESLKFFILTGEPVTAAKKKILKTLHPGVKFFVRYGASETGSLAFQCEYLSQREDCVLFHPRLADARFEIINAGTGQPAEPGAKGELVVTDFWNKATPLIRYRTGDMASFHKNDCPCEEPGPLLQIWGRIDRDFVRAGGFEIRRDMLEKPLLNLRDCLNEGFEAHLYENFVNAKPKIKMILNLSLKNKGAEPSEVKKRVQNEFLENCRLSPSFNLKTAVEAGLFEPLQINFVDFPESTKTPGALILH